MKIVVFILTAVLVSVCGFIFHVFITEWITPYIQHQLNDIQVVPSWNVRYLAALSSIETGIGMTFLYILLRDRLPSKNAVARGGILALIELAIMGRLIRQPLMDYAIGNPLYIAILQNMDSWLVWLVIGITTTLLYDFLSVKLLFRHIKS